ncbi:hypothetical protein A8B78_22295 [Jannaschia sp. EhC01]|nr:hypothetical protein A8B78_22295 [Jannaschia sp. EhC01]
MKDLEGGGTVELPTQLCRFSGKLSHQARDRVPVFGLFLSLERCVRDPHLQCELFARVGKTASFMAHA